MLSRRTFSKGVLAAPLVAAGRAAPVWAESRVIVAQPSQGFLYLTLYLARGLRYFEQEGLDVEVSVFSRGAAAALTAVIAREATVYVGLPAITLQAWLKGQRTTLFAGLVNQCGSDVVLSGDIAAKVHLASRGDAAEKAAALRGLTIAVAGVGSITDLVVRHIARFGGLDPDRDVTIVPIGDGSNMLAAFAQGRIDGYCLSAPTSTTGIVKMGGVLLFDFAQHEYPPLSDFLFTALAAREEWLETHKQDAILFVKALIRAVDTARTAPDVAKQAIRPFYASVDAEVFEAAWHQAITTLPSTLRIEASSVTKNLEYLEQARAQRVDIPIEGAFTNTIVQQAEAALARH